jgi:hypothetical protein
MTKEQQRQLLQRILSKCRDDAGCLVWTGAMAGGNCPSMKVGRKAKNIRRLYYELTIGPVPAGMNVTSACECKACLKHLEAQSVAQILGGAVARGAYGQRHAAKVAAARRRGAKFSDEVIRQIRASDELGTELAERLGMDQSYLSRVRRGEARKDYSNPFLALGALA